jgi:hypothetical protein
MYYFLETLRNKRNEYLTSFEHLHYVCVSILAAFGLFMLITMFDFKNNLGLGEHLSHYAGAAIGATMIFMVFFSIIIFLLIPLLGSMVTLRREGSAHSGIALNCGYGTCLSCFGFIPLFIVSTALLELGSGSQSDLVAECYWNVHNSD